MHDQRRGSWFGGGAVQLAMLPETVAFVETVAFAETVAFVETMAHGLRRWLEHTDGGEPWHAAH
jgi:hypothetical protein